MPTVPTEEIQISQLVSPAEISYSSLASLAIRRRFAGLTRWDIWISSVGTVGISPILDFYAMYGAKKLSWKIHDTKLGNQAHFLFWFYTER